MSKIKTAYFCQSCGYESTKWSGKCPGCQQWNTFVEELIQKDIKKNINDWKTYNGESSNKKKQVCWFLLRIAEILQHTHVFAIPIRVMNL